ncbi:MAG: diacylglycerol kinase family lipid kinase [Alphaproteobacteria bacterium]|nr:diacylglycerol kinase family lipid kinase [Alphaproteobacteria bacterium]
MRGFVVVNPHAGSGRTGRRWPAIARDLAAHIGPFDHALTTGPGHATELVRSAIDDGASLVIAVGGDGTINEAVNGFSRADGAVTGTCAFAALAGGTGSDFMRGLSLSHTNALARIASGQTRQIDLGRVTFTSDDGRIVSRLFINIAGMGLSGAVDRAVNASGSFGFLPGIVTYYLATLSALWRYSFSGIRLSVDGQAPITINLAMAAIANGTHFGGGMNIAPHAKLDSGTFEVIVLRGGSKLTMMRDFPQLCRGTHMNHPMITALRGRRVTAEPVDPATAIPVDLDGESPGHLKAEFEILPGALKLQL